MNIVEVCSTCSSKVGIFGHDFYSSVGLQFKPARKESCSKKPFWAKNTLTKRIKSVFDGASYTGHNATTPLSQYLTYFVHCDNIGYTFPSTFRNSMYACQSEFSFRHYNPMIT